MKVALDIAAVAGRRGRADDAPQQGLGNKFLDDLRHADVLLHVVDASGTTNAKGEPSEGYDPLLDVRWLREEIEAYVVSCSLCIRRLYCVHCN